MQYHACSAIIVRKLDNKVFVAKRKSNKVLSPGKWETIGGKIEEDESFEDCIRREIKEELNTEIKSLKEFRDYIFNTIVFKVFIIQLEGKATPNANDFENWGWFSREEIEKMDFGIDCKKRILDYFDSILQKDKN